MSCRLVQVSQPRAHRLWAASLTAFVTKVTIQVRILINEQPKCQYVTRVLKAFIKHLKLFYLIYLICCYFTLLY
jgi:hypothetical protein